MLNNARRSVFVLLALGALFAAACGELQQQAADPSAAGGTSVVAENTATPPAATATATTAAAASATTAPLAPTAVPVASPQSLRAGEVAKADGSYRMGPLTFRMPPDVSLSTAITLNDPGGNILVLYDPASGSSLKLDPNTGIERSRYVTEAKWNAVFDFVAASVALAQ